MQRFQPANISPASPLACAKEMLDAMPQVMWFIRRHMRQHRTRGMSIPQFRTLVLLDSQPTASLSHLAEHLGSSLPTASRIVSGLVSKGLVIRQTSATDRRQCELQLTGTGRAVLSAGRRATEDRLSAELARLSDDDRQTVFAAMKLLNSVFVGDTIAETKGAEAG